ncbi:MAG: hypothetical protein LBH81_03090 [Rickettsiales bacterium]|jgi:hypothetical protein|nr:hypothetical protein [Rickettsiales bacterium]
MKKALIAIFALFAAGPALAGTGAEMNYGNNRVPVAEQAQAASARKAYIEAQNLNSDVTVNIDYGYRGRETEDKTPASEPLEDNPFAAYEDAYAENDDDDNFERPAPAESKWPTGMQFGLGLTVMPGHNWFIGYANKKFDSFWWKRIGGRLDITTPMTLNAKATLHDTASGHELAPEANLWFYNYQFGSEKIDAVEIDGTKINLEGVKAQLEMRHQNFGALLDIYPFGDTWFLGGFRATAGYYTGSLELGANAFFPNHTPTNGFVQAIDNTNDELKFRVKGGSKFGANLNWKYNGPYLGAGFDLGILWGFKIYMDAGAVWTKPLKIKENDIDDRSLVIEACYSMDGGQCDWTALVRGMNAPNVDEIVRTIVSQAVAGQINANRDQFELEYGITIPTDNRELAGNITDFLINGTCANCGWLDDIAGGSDTVSETLNQIRDEVLGTAGGDTIQTKIDDIWGDYHQQRNDAIHDANKALNDCGSKCQFMPIFKLGFMYRF